MTETITVRQKSVVKIIHVTEKFRVMLLGTKKPTDALRRIGLSAGLLPTPSCLGFSHFPSF